MQWLTKSALVGTSKSPPPAVAADDPADQLVAKIKGDDRESELLLRAGVHAIAAISGAMPAAATAPPAPAPEEDSPPCSDKLVSLLQNLFAAEQKDLFPEFLSQLTAGGLLLPPELLPPALDIADPKIRTRLLPVLGKRGVWLSQFNPAWSWVTAGAGELSADDRNALKTTWEEGNIALRCQVLGRLRTADPPTAREWLEETFKSEKADHRNRLLAELGEGLGHEDEEFLEFCLGDRSEPVRNTAAALLSRIAGSKLGERMSVRAAGILSGTGKGKRLKLSCTLPTEKDVDKEWLRDGVPKSGPSGRGKRAVWGEAVLAAIPPRHWEERFSATPQELIAAIANDDHTHVVMCGWTIAVTRFASQDKEAKGWLRPLFDYWLEALGQKKGKQANETFARIQTLMPLMPPQDAEVAVVSLFEKGGSAGETYWISLLDDLPKPWSVEFTQQYFEFVRRFLERHSDNYAYQVISTLQTAARSIPRESFAVALEPWMQPDEDKRKSHVARWIAGMFDRFQDTIRMRQSFYAELEGTK